MPNVTVQLKPETIERLRERASQSGETVEAYIERVAEREADGEASPYDALAEGIAWLRNRTPEEIQATRERILAASPPLREPPPGKTVLDMVVGKWPGTETDAEIREALDRMS